MFEQFKDNFNNYYDIFPNGKIFRVTYDQLLNKLKILAKNQDTFNELREAFSVENDSAFFSKQYGYHADEKKYIINKFGYFEPGLYKEIIEWIKNTYGDVSFLAISKNCINYINTYLKPLNNVKNFKVLNISEDSGRNEELIQQNKRPYTFRDYQYNSIKAWIQKGFGRGLIEIPTSGGKSFIISNLIWSYLNCIDNKAKTLILVPNTQLVEQFFKDLIDYGFKRQQLAKFTGTIKTKKQKEENDINSAKIIIANRQYIFKNKNILPKIDVLICDEVHQVTADSSYEFVSSLNCKVKLGCTGTLPKDKYELWKLYGIFTQVVYKEDIVDLQNRGFISKLKMTLLDIFSKEVENNRDYLFNVNSFHKYHPDDENNDILFGDAYASELEFYQKRYQQIYTPVLKYLNKLEENIIVLFDKIETGKNVFELSKEIISTKKSFYIDGQTPIEEREIVRQSFETSGNNILVGNVSILGTGINIKRLSHIVFLASTKSYSRTIQSIGRTLRLHEMKNEAHLIDIRCNFKYSQKHFEERMKFYRQVYKKKGFDEVIKIEI